MRIGAHDVRCSVKLLYEPEDLQALETELFEGMHAASLTEILRKIDQSFGQSYYTLRQLPFEQRKQIVSLLTHEMVEKISQDHELLFDQNRTMNEIYRSMNLPIPPEIRFIAEFTLARRIKAAVIEASRFGFELKKATAVTKALKDVKAFGIELNTKEATQFLSSELKERMRGMEQLLKFETIQECSNIMKLASKIEAPIDLREVQDRLFFLVKKWVFVDQAVPEVVQKNPEEFMQLLKEFHISIDGLPALLHKRVSTS